MLFILTIPSLWSLFQPGFFTFNDETQIANLHQFIKVIDLGQFPPRWAPDFHFTYGSPYPEFNYQLPYYLGWVTHHLGFSLTDSYKLLLGLTLPIGALGMFLLAGLFTSAPLALASAVIYTYTPYRAVDIYVRGTVGESFALAIFPFIVYFLFRLSKNQNTKNILLCTVSVSALILSHQIATVLFLPPIFILFAILCKKSIKSLFLVTVFSICLTAYYLLPTLLEQSFIQPVAPFNFIDHFPFIKQLVYSPWGYGSSHWGPDDQISFQIGVVNLLVVAVTLIKIKSNKSITNGFLFLFFLSGIFMNIRTKFFWELFPLTPLIQFPWRLLMLTTFFSSALSIFLFTSKKLQSIKLLPTIIIIVTIVLNLTYFEVGERTQNTDQYFLRHYLPTAVLLHGETVSKDYLSYSEEYYPLPVNAARPKEVPLQKLAASSSAVNVADSSPFSYSATIESPFSTLTTYHVFDYPGWTIYQNSQKIPHSKDALGAITFDLPSGNSDITIKYENTPLRAFSNLISVFTILFLIGTLLKLSCRPIKAKSV